jgi:hypothetical protein
MSIIMNKKTSAIFRNIIGIMVAYSEEVMYNDLSYFFAI